jgi:hypothetical protein
MLYFPNGRPQISTELPIASGASIAAEGQALVGASPLGVFGVAPSAGTSGEIFLGLAVSQQIALTSYPKVEEFVDPNTDTWVLARTPLSSTFSLYDETANALLTGGGTDYTLSSKTLTMNTALRGHTLRAVYKFAPSAVEARAIMGDVYPGGAAGTSIGQVGIIQKGTVYTTEYDSTLNWNQTATVKTGANGLLVQSGNGATVNCVIVSVPTLTNPYLGLMLI